MNKAQIKKMVSFQLREIELATCNVNVNSWKRARAIYEIKNMVNWGKSPYKTFTCFCEENLANRSTAMWVSDASSYGSALKLGYTDKNVFDLAPHHPYTRLARFFKTATKKIAVSKLKKAELPTAGITKRTKKPANQFCFSLSKEHTNKLIALLEPYGLVITNQTKTGASMAMEAYLDTVI